MTWRCQRNAVLIGKEGGKGRYKERRKEEKEKGRRPQVTSLSCCDGNMAADRDTRERYTEDSSIATALQPYGQATSCPNAGGWPSGDCTNAAAMLAMLSVK